MGRTKRHRSKRNKQNIQILNYDSKIIELNRWMKKNSWFNETKLKFASFPDTGRGLMTTVQFDPGDIIIELPFTLMISYAVVEDSINFKSFLSTCTEKLLIHELLNLYLIFEYHLEDKSFWYSYIKSLPTLNEISTLLLCTEEELKLLNEDVLIFVMKERNKLEEYWTRAKLVLNSDYVCAHCKSRGSDLVSRDLYIWAHYIVNTRTVYVDPEKVLHACNSEFSDILLDEPSMALCPFLDMINHSSNTHTNAYLSDFDGNYFLVTNSTFKKYEQVFISYGAHDNKRLLYQYGFVVPQNIYDTIEFPFQEFLSILKINASSKQYKFLHERNLLNLLFMSHSGPSFNMAAVLYVLTNENDVDWTIRVYCSEYSCEQLKVMHKLAKILLEFKINQYKNKLEQLMSNVDCYSRHFKIFFAYLDNQIDCIKWIIRRNEVKLKL